MPTLDAAAAACGGIKFVCNIRGEETRRVKACRIKEVMTWLFARSGCLLGVAVC